MSMSDRSADKGVALQELTEIFAAVDRERKEKLSEEEKKFREKQRKLFVKFFLIGYKSVRYYPPTNEFHTGKLIGVGGSFERVIQTVKKGFTEANVVIESESDAEQLGVFSGALFGLIEQIPHVKLRKPAVVVDAITSIAKYLETIDHLPSHKFIARRVEKILKKHGRDMPEENFKLLREISEIFVSI